MFARDRTGHPFWYRTGNSILRTVKETSLKQTGKLVGHTLNYIRSRRLSNTNYPPTPKADKLMPATKRTPKGRRRHLTYGKSMKGKSVNERNLKHKHKYKKKYNRAKKKLAQTQVDPAQQHSAPESLSKLFRIGKRGKVKGKLNGHLRYMDDFNGGLSTTAGKQNFAVVNETLNIKQFTTDSGFADFYRTWYGMFSMDPNKAYTGSSLWVAGTSVSDRVHINDVTNHFTARNLESDPCYLAVYTFLAQKEAVEDPVTTWNDIMAAEAPGKGATTYGGAGLAGGAVPGYPSSVSPFLRPESHREFNKIWKTIGVQHIAMAGGSEVTFNQTLSYNKGIDYQYIANLTSTDANQRYLAGYSVVTCFMVRGALVDDQTTVTSANCTYGKSLVGYVINRNYSLKSLTANKRIQTGIAVYNIPSGATLANEKQVDMQDIVSSVVVS